MTGLTLAPESAEWVHTITASKVPVILGLSPYQGPAALWLTMRGDVDYEPDDNDAITRGHFLEPYALHWAWNRRHTGWEQLAGETTWSRDDLGFHAAANTDSHGTNHNGDLVIIEAKSAGWGPRLAEWGKEGTDEVPLSYVAQTMWQMHMTHGPGGPGITTAHIERVGPGIDDHYWYTVTYDPAMANAITDKVAEFVASLDDDQACPPVDGLESTYRTFVRANPDLVKDTEWEVSPELAIEYTTAREQEKAWTARLNAAKSELLRVMGTSQYAVCQGQKIARRQMAKGRPTVYPPSKAPDMQALHDAERNIAA